ncbi:FKBP-type peptidyl-prolyl cis-trans isomerase N-terminal domain-containing protein [Verrucomicrobiaceae bacterium 227]
MKAPLLHTLLLIGVLSGQEPLTSPPPVDKTPLKTASLALGHQEGKRALLKQMNADDIDRTAFLEGFLKGLNGESLDLSVEEILEAMSELQTRIKTRELETAKANKLAEEEFFKENAKASNVIQSDSGMQYRIVERGQGEPFGLEALEDHQILLHYRGTLPDGREFTASNDDAPVKIKIAETIPGFREALAKMRPGAKWVVYVPSSLAYGDQRHSDMIGPNQMLIFEISSIEILPPEK